jgi:hypothetical protein
MNRFSPPVTLPAKAAWFDFSMLAGQAAKELGRPVALGFLDRGDRWPWLIYDPQHPPSEALGTELRAFCPPAGGLEVVAK